MGGFTKPTTTPTPDALFDYWLPRLAGAEMRVLLYGVRRTFGFGKESDTISLDQFLHGIRTRDGRVLDEGTGIRGRSTLTIALRKLTEKGLLIKEKRSDPEFGDQVNNYRLVIAENPSALATYGFRPVNTTPVPDELFDYWLARLSDAELYVLLYVIRRTLGFRKQADTISVRQFRDGVRTREGHVLDEGCGIRTNKYLYMALRGLEEKGLIASERRIHEVRGNVPTRYRLVFEGDTPPVLAIDPRTLPDHDTAETHIIGRSTTPRSGAEQGSSISQQTGERLVNIGQEQHLREPSSVSKPRGTRLLNRGGTTAALRLNRATEPRSGERSDSQQIDLQETELHRDRYSNPRQSRSKVHEHNGDRHSPDVQQLKIENRGDATAPASQRQVQLTPDYRAILAALGTRAQDFGDEAPLRSSTMRAYHIMQGAGATLADFLQLLDEAEAITRSAQASIRKRRTDSTEKNRMPYFFTVLERLAHPEVYPGQMPASGSGRSGTRRSMPPVLVTNPLPISEENVVWRDVLEELRFVMTPENFNTWLAPTRVIVEQSDVLKVAVPKLFHKSWLEQKLAPRVRAALDRLGYAGVRIDYVVQPEGE